MSEIYYKITGGPIKAAYEKAVAKHKEVVEGIQSFTKELGATKACVSSCGIRSFEFEVKPKGWKKHPRISGYIPGAKMLEIQGRMQALVLPSGDSLLEEISGRDAGCVLIGTTMYSASAAYEIIDDSIAILKLNTKPKGYQENDWGDWWVPTEDVHCTKLKDSEYWALVESKTADVG